MIDEPCQQSQTNPENMTSMYVKKVFADGFKNLQPILLKTDLM